MQAFTLHCSPMIFKVFSHRNSILNTCSVRPKLHAIAGLRHNVERANFPSARARAEIEFNGVRPSSLVVARFCADIPNGVLTLAQKAI